MEMTRERYQSAQEEKKQLTLKVEELERSEILGSCSLNLPFLSSSHCFFSGLKQLQSCSSPPCASRILCICLSHKDL